MRSPKGAKILPKRLAGVQMSERTLAKYLGLLLEDPYDTELVDGLRELLKSPNPANDDQDPLRLLEAARGGHERRGEFLAAS